jgi:hypothetical protein
VNDLFQNARILEILPDTVILEAEGKQEVLIITYEFDQEGKAGPGGEAQNPSSGKAYRNRLPGTVRPPGRK